MAVQQLYVAPQASRPALRRIRRLSLPFEILFAALAMLNALLLLMVVWIVFYGGQHSGLHLFVGPDSGELIVGEITAYPRDSIDVSELPLRSRLAGLIIAVGVLGSIVAACYCLHRLFGAYRRGIVFAEAPIRWMRRAGFFLVAAGVAPFAFQPLVQAAGLLDERWLPRQSLAFLIIGAALFVLANILALGREIEREGEGYV